MRLPWKRAAALPPALAGRLAEDELVTAAGTTVTGVTLVCTRRGLWVVPDQQDGDSAHRIGWAEFAKATLAGGRLTLVPVVEIAAGDDGTSLVRDGAPIEYRFAGPTKVTDQVHTRVRRSVAASRYVPWPGCGAWIALRRVPGRDGLLTQVRLDPGADPAAPGFAEAADRVVADLRGSKHMGITGVDD